MNKRELQRLDRELSAYLDSMTDGMGRPERRQAMRDYLTGLLLDGDRKSIEPMAGRLVDDASEIQAMRQRLQQCVTVSPWSDDEVWKRLALKGDAELPELEAWVVDDTGFPKKGEHSVGVQRQYSGTLGRKDNCQVAVSLHLASERGSLCIGVRLYMPESWTSDPARCRQVGVPDDVTFRTKWQLSLEQIDAALAWGLRPKVVLADPGYGDVTEYRDGLVERKVDYVVGIQSSLVAWARGRQGSRFGAVRVRMAHRHSVGAPPGDELWLVYEWPSDEDEPTKFWLSTLPAKTPLKQLVRLAKLRWRVERDYQELKQEIGLDHFEGRGWRGFHHHATLCAVAHAFLALRRALFPPEAHAVDAARS